MPSFRCYACRTEFDAGDKSPTCPGCGSSGDSAVARLEIVHLDPPAVPFDPDKPHVRRGKHHAACDDRLKVGRGGRFTGETGAVTCPKCKLTEAFKDAEASGL